MGARYTDALHKYAVIDNADGSTTSGVAVAIERLAQKRGVTVDDYAPPAITWADIRSKRDGLLAETDWVVVKAQEVGEAVPAAWVTYRQALRDLPANTADPANPVWPSAP
jgi:hypothetical protein